MTDSIAVLWPATAAAFLASLVEAVEALTIVLAVATVRGWRPAGLGALFGLGVLAAIVLALGPLLDRIPLHLLQLLVCVLILLFGMRWLRKAILRLAGVIQLHDEGMAFAAETAAFRKTRSNSWSASCCRHSACFGPVKGLAWNGRGPIWRSWHLRRCFWRSAARR